MFLYFSRLAKVAERQAGFEAGHSILLDSNCVLLFRTTKSPVRLVKYGTGLLYSELPIGIFRQAKGVS